MTKSNVFRIIFALLTISFCSLSTYSKAEIQVYDNNDQYLGILLNVESEQVMTIFIPSLKVSYNLYDYINDNSVPCFYNVTLVFESNDCSGTPYVYGVLPSVKDLSCTSYGGFFIPDDTKPKQFAAHSALKYDTNTGSATCIDWTTNVQIQNNYEIKEIQLPFTVPIALPLNFIVEGAGGDLTGNGTVDGSDLAIFAQHFGTTQ